MQNPSSPFVLLLTFLNFLHLQPSTTPSQPTAYTTAAAISHEECQRGRATGIGRVVRQCSCMPCYYSIGGADRRQLLSKICHQPPPLWCSPSLWFFLFYFFISILFFFYSVYFCSFFFF